MFRNKPFVHPHNCVPCKGTGRIGMPFPPRSYDCTSCNGTGIAGNPAVPVYIVLVSMLCALGGLLYWLFG